MPGVSTPLPDLRPLDLSFGFSEQGDASCRLAAGDWKYDVDGFTDNNPDTFVEFLIAAISEDCRVWRTSRIRCEFEPDTLVLEVASEIHHRTMTPYTVLRALPGSGQARGAKAAIDENDSIPLFEIPLKRGAFAGAVSHAFKTFAENPAERFEDYWGHAFPIKAYNALLACRDTTVRVQRPDQRDTTPAGFALSTEKKQ